jgi:hypothetical protein
VNNDNKDTFSSVVVKSRIVDPNRELYSTRKMRNNTYSLKCKLHISCLASSVTTEDIVHMFARFSPKKVYISPKNKTYGWITFASNAKANEALKKLNNEILMAKNISGLGTKNTKTKAVLHCFSTRCQLMIQQP